MLSQRPTFARSSPSLLGERFVLGPDGLEIAELASGERSGAVSPSIQALQQRQLTSMDELLSVLPEWATYERVDDESIDVHLPVPPGAIPNVSQVVRITHDPLEDIYHVQGGSPHVLKEVTAVLEKIRAIGNWDAIQGMDPAHAPW